MGDAFEIHLYLQQVQGHWSIQTSGLSLLSSIVTIVYSSRATSIVFGHMQAS
jgi:hypothetical protein